jgi:hypothetical protein
MKEQRMNRAHKLYETTKERLERVAKSSHPFCREVGGPRYLIAVALLVLIVLLVAIGIIGGSLGSSVVGEHARRVMQSVWPSGR